MDSSYEWTDLPTAAPLDCVISAIAEWICSCFAQLLFPRTPVSSVCPLFSARAIPGSATEFRLMSWPFGLVQSQERDHSGQPGTCSSIHADPIPWPWPNDVKSLQQAESSLIALAFPFWPSNFQLTRSLIKEPKRPWSGFCSWRFSRQIRTREG